MKYTPDLYDLDPRLFLKDEVEFYKILVSRLKPKTILELGVGTGRIFSHLLPMVEIATGIDISDEMLQRCRMVCGRHKNYVLYNANFVNLNLRTVFDLIYLPFNTFQHILEEKEQERCLKSILSHMDKNTRFILDVMNGDAISNLEINKWKQDYSTNLSPDKFVERGQKTVAIDKDKSIVHKIFKYTGNFGDGKVGTKEFDAFMRITPNVELQKLIKETGFEIEHIWHDYFFQNNIATNKMIYCLKRHAD